MSRPARVANFYKVFWSEDLSDFPVPVVFTLPEEVAEALLTVEYFANAIDPNGVRLELVLDGEIVGGEQLTRSEAGHRGAITYSLREPKYVRVEHTLSVSATSQPEFLGKIILAVMVKGSDVEFFPGPFKR